MKIITPQEILDIANGTHKTCKPGLLKRTDGVGLLYAGRIHFIGGEPGIGKTWVALIAAAEQLNNGNHVLFIDFEGVPTTHISRLQQLGVSDEAIVNNFHYARPHGNSGGIPPHVRNIAASCTLTIIDNVGEAITSNGLSQDSDDDLTWWHQHYIQPISATGCTVLVVDYIKKSADTRKFTAIDGAAYIVSGTSPVKGGIGIIKLTTVKDRNGTHPRNEVAAEIVMMSLHGGMAVKIR